MRRPMRGALQWPLTGLRKGTKGLGGKRSFRNEVGTSSSDGCGWGLVMVVSDCPSSACCTFSASAIRLRRASLRVRGNVMPVVAVE